VAMSRNYVICELGAWNGGHGVVGELGAAPWFQSNPGGGRWPAQTLSYGYCRAPLAWELVGYWS
jgi:hypothetical protein